MKKSTEKIKSTQKESKPEIPESIMKAAREDLKDFETQSRTAFLQRLEMERKLDL